MLTDDDRRRIQEEERLRFEARKRLEADEEARRAAEAERKKKESERQSEKVGYGCLGLIVVLVLCGWLFTGDEEVIIEGDTASVEITLFSADSLDGAAGKVARTIYGIAGDNPDIKKVSVTLTMSTVGLTDHHGNKPPEDALEMGTLDEDAEDVRRFKDEGYYLSGRLVAFRVLISNMSHAEFLDE